METDFMVGTLVKISGRRGTWRICGFNKDGSLSLYGGWGQRRMYRDSFPSECQAVKEPPYRKPKS